MAAFTAIADFLFEICTEIFNTYISSQLLAFVLALWVIRRVVKVFLHL